MISLTTRLTLLFALVSACLYASLGYLIKSSIEEHFATRDYTELQDKIQLASALLHNFHNRNTLTSIETIMSQAVNDNDTISIQLTADNGETLFHSGDTDIPAEFKSTVVAPGKFKHLNWQKQGIRYRALATTLPAYSDSTSPIHVIAAISTRRHAQFLIPFIHRLAELMIAATLLSALLGWWVARQGLSPLRAMAAKARIITAKRLNQRLEIDSLPVEIGTLARNLNTMFDRLQDSFSRLNHFSGDIAHELRTPVSNLMTQTQVALSKPRNADEYREILASNLEELERLSRMTSDMLFLAQADNGLELPHPEPLKLDEEISKLLEFYEALAEDRHIHLSCHGQGTLIGDRLMMRRALSNLLSNAIKHTPPAGHIDFHLEHTIRHLKVAVTNSGTPIAESDLPFLFDRFFRCDPARSHLSNEGTGLGLPIAQAIIKAHHGLIEVTTDTHSTTFTLMFPLERAIQ